MRPRLLLVAYCCSPEGGSEPAVGWTLARLAAERFDTTVIVEERKFRPAIDRWLSEHGHPPGLTFQYVPEKWWAHGMWACGLGYLSYRWWHARARRVADRLHAECPFDAVQLATIIGFREPGSWTDLPAARGGGSQTVPFIWGPVGGTHNYPAAFLAEAGPVAAAKEHVRSLVNNRQLRGRRVRNALQAAHTVVAATRDTRSALRSVVNREYPIVSEITLREASPPTPPKREIGSLRILWSGLHEPRKCLSLLIRAVAGLSSPGDVRVRVLGDGPMRRRWQRLARAVGVDALFEWPGWVSHDEVADQYRWADVFAFTSVRDTTGTVLLEALDVGLPVITLNHQGARDVVTDDCGIRVSCEHPAATVRELTAAIERLASDERLRQRMSDAAVARADAYRLPAKRTQWAGVWDRVAGLRSTATDRAASPLANGATTAEHKTAEHETAEHETAAAFVSQCEVSYEFA